MARLKQLCSPLPLAHHPAPRLTDRIRDGAIETKGTSARLILSITGLPIGFAMARLKLPVLGDQKVPRWLTDRIRDGAIETPVGNHIHVTSSQIGLPIGFAMARLKQPSRS